MFPKHCEFSARKKKLYDRLRAEEYEGTVDHYIVYIMVRESLTLIFAVSEQLMGVLNHSQNSSKFISTAKTTQQTRIECDHR